MTNHKFSILIISIFLSAILLPISYAQAPAVLTNFTVLDPNGNDVTDEFLVAGGSYTINFEIEIGATLSDNILLTTSMEKSGNSFWTLNNNYQGVDTSVWTPGSQSITFQAVEGIAQFTLDGKIPESITEKDVVDMDKTVHAFELVPLLVMSLDSMEILDERTYTITDQTIISYDVLLQSKLEKLNSISMEGKYNSLALEIVSEAEYLTTFGLYDDAIKLLNTIPDSDYPAPPSTTTLFIIASAILGITTIAFALLFIRIRSSSSYLSSSISEKADKLDLTKEEKNLVELFPESEIINVACHSAVNYHGYSIIKNGKKRRLKVISSDTPKIEFGDRIEEEDKIYSTSYQKDGQNYWKDEDDDEDFAEDQLMEDFTFGIAKRRLGVLLDHSDGEELMESVQFKKWSLL